MIKNILKRDGRKVKYDRLKITEAIHKAALSIDKNDYDLAFDLSLKVEEYLEKVLLVKEPTVEQIQDTVEKILIDSGFIPIAKNYILYRADRTRVREMDTRLMKTYENITFKSAKEDDNKRENANINADTAMGTMLKYGSEGVKEFYEKFVLNPIHSKAHNSGDIHIHDLDFLTLTMTCCQIDIVALFKGGFSTGHGFLREPNSIQSYGALACIAIQANQNDQHGGQSIPNFDYGMALGVQKTYIKSFTDNFNKAVELVTNAVDFSINEILSQIKKGKNLFPNLSDNQELIQNLKEKLPFINENDFEKVIHFTLKNAYKETDKATFQSMESFIHNLNTMHSRAGAQVPFSSINYGTDTSEEGRMVIKNILLVTEKGLGHGETAIFPIHIFKVKDGINFNQGDPNYDLFKLACQVSSKRLFPNFSFIDAPFNLKYYKGTADTEISYMGCRTRVISNIYDKTQEIVSGRGNLSFTSINLPRLGMKANKDLGLFFKMLNEQLEIVCDQLLERFEIQAKKKVRNFPFLMGQGVWLDSDKLGIDDEVREVIKHGTLSVGFIGLAECLIALTGNHQGETEEAQKLGLEIISFMRKSMDQKALKYHLNFSLIATPAEGLSGRFVNLDKKEYGIIKNITDKEYYTNSFHIPVGYQISAFKKIEIEAPYHELTNAGHITYVELDSSPSKNLDAFEKIIRHMKQMGIGYGSINHPLDRDPVCGYSGTIDNECPHCGRIEDDVKFERIRRITGYLVGTLDRFNNAKRSEVRDRVKHGNI